MDKVLIAAPRERARTFLEDSNSVNWEQRLKLDNLTREDLYGLVWSEAMVTLAPKLGLSDVGLKKRCAKQGVPVPPRGYWAKLAAGKRVVKSLLPKTWNAAKAKQPKLRTIEDVKVPIPLRDSYPIEEMAKPAATALRVLRKAKPSYDGYVRVGGTGNVSIECTPARIERAAWLWSELLKQMKKQKLSLVPTGSCSVTDGLESIEVTMKEPKTFYYRPFDASRDRSYEMDEKTKMVRVDAPSGLLAFRAGEYTYSNRNRWKDTHTTPLETRIEEIVLAIAKLLEEKHRDRLARVESEKRSAEAARLRAIEAEKVRIEEKRREKLVAFAKSFDQAEQIRRFVNQLGSECDLYREWALGVAAALDPSAQISEKIKGGEDPFEEKPRNWW